MAAHATAGRAGSQRTGWLSALALTACLLAAPAFGQTEADILKWAEEGRPQVKAGQLTELQFHKELYRRIAATPSDVYPFKAENLRIIGFRVDIWEDVEAGKMTPERAERKIAEQQAQWEAENHAREEAAHQAKKRAWLADLDRKQQAEAADEAQRRAMALQLLQSGAFRPIPPVRVPMPPAPRPTVNCTTQTIGNQAYTNCR